jgi:hypothetical protein
MRSVSVESRRRTRARSLRETDGRSERFVTIGPASTTTSRTHAVTAMSTTVALSSAQLLVRQLSQMSPKELIHTDRHDPAAKTAAVCEGSSEYDSRGQLNRSDVSAPRGDSASADRSPACGVAVDVDRASMRTDSPRRETVVRTRLIFLCV